MISISQSVKAYRHTPIALSDCRTKVLASHWDRSWSLRLATTWLTNLRALFLIYMLFVVARTVFLFLLTLSRRFVFCSIAWKLIFISDVARFSIGVKAQWLTRILTSQLAWSITLCVLPNHRRANGTNEHTRRASDYRQTWQAYDYRQPISYSTRATNFSLMAKY